jgi:hypothetical protein
MDRAVCKKGSAPAAGVDAVICLLGDGRQRVEAPNGGRPAAEGPEHGGALQGREVRERRVAGGCPPGAARLVR